ncbi:AraC family transcriptional regulator [Gordonia alkanivorans]|uniref:Thc operon regulatory protein n=1 Tax=Gordonia alkanivorans NBRC 16433 TaxID=1027371 RepID=F9VSA2_9ACTN|nr:AraC family transcriptional regulator [Gordonia alkanivorans]GAA11491.1 thc operon regulatory protein [Gordonia alkanivorans NBRC 16433]
MSGKRAELAMRTPPPPVLVDTADPVEAAELLGSSYCPHRVHVEGSSRDFRAIQTEVTVSDVAIHTLRYGTDVRIDPDPLGAWVLVSTPMRGRLTIRSGAESRTLGPGESVAIDSYRAFELTWRQNCQLRTLRLPLTSVVEAAQLAGAGTTRPVRFGLGDPATTASARSWQSVVALAERDARMAGELSRSPLLSEQMSRMIATTLVATHPLLAIPGDDRPAVPRQIRKAVELIERSPDEDLTVTRLAVAAGVGVRALQQGFRQHLQMSPTEYLRQTRLERAHHQLLRENPSTVTVAEIAHSWGFGNLGRFSQMYRGRYGRLPSQTLRD